MVAVSPRAPLPRHLLGGLSARRQAASAIAATVVLATMTLVLRAVRDDVSLALVFLVYFAAVVALSAAGGPLVGVATALVAFLVVNFFFTEPLHTLDVAEAEQLVELLIFLAVSGTVATLVDTASRRRLEIEQQSAEAARLSAANELRTALLRAVSHDLRTPLTTAKMATSSLRATDVEFDEAARSELLELADTEIDRLVAIIENLLDAGRLQAGALRPEHRLVQVSDLVEHTLASLPAPDRERVVSSVDRQVGAIITDPALLERVLANLVANALAAEPDAQVALSARTAPGGAVVLDVIDRGPGLTAAQRAAAFEPFHRLEDRAPTSGIGLGLTICKGFCEAIGVELDLLDTPGGGLTARVTVPVPERGA